MKLKELPRPQTRAASAPLMEIFSSIQGEGAYLGEPQIFVRFARCPLRCLYCDTPGSWVVREQYRVIAENGAKLYPNPATPKKVLEHCRALERSESRPLTVSLTGGEPLLYPEFIAELASLLKKEGRRVHLETAGVHPHNLEKVLHQIDHVSMDWKISSTLEKGDFGVLQKQFLAAALRVRKKDLVVKIVVTPDVTEPEFKRAMDSVAAIDRDVPVIVQPATPARKIHRRVSAEKLRRFTRLASARSARVRVLPQLHPLMKMK